MSLSILQHVNTAWIKGEYTYWHRGIFQKSTNDRDVHGSNIKLSAAFLAMQ